MSPDRSLRQQTTPFDDPPVPAHHTRGLDGGLPSRASHGPILLLWLIVLFAGSPGPAAERRVPREYPTITAAIAAADNGDTIRIAAGTYSRAKGESLPLRLQKAVTLEGDPNNKPHLQGDKAHTVVLIESGGATLRGLHITGGRGSEGINKMDGGGVCIFVGPNERNAVKIERCLVEDNDCPSDETYDGCGGGIYCGGTYCTCFQITISNCVVRRNSVRGCGGGVFCALLSNVKMDHTRLDENTADDHGGGAFVDVYALLTMTTTSLLANRCPGDPLKPDWGGKGGGLACESYGLFTATDCTFSENMARFFGGGIFTRGGDLTGEGVCAERPFFSRVSNCRIEKNLAKTSGGGVYVASSATLQFSGTTFYWNDANQPEGDGGAAFVAGSPMGGGAVHFDANCVLEGNESARHGGGVCLGQGALGTFDATKFLGNSSLLDGGAMFLDGAAAMMSNCLIAYNNSARGLGGALRALPQSSVDLVHCSVVGNFAPRKRGGLYLDAGATADIKDSILWRNAGGSVEANSAATNITQSLNEDGANPAQGVLCCDPGYVGWSNWQTVYVDASVKGPGTGTAASPYRDLQLALSSFDFRLAVDSPCLGSASDGGNMGSSTGVGGTAGNVTALLHLADGTYDIRGRNIIFTRGLQGRDPNTSVIRHAVLGYVENASVKKLGIESEELFGGITIRADANFVDCSVSDNTSLADGGGIYAADGNCVLTRSFVSRNTAATGNGGGIYLCPQSEIDLAASCVDHNASKIGKGGGIYASADTALSMIESGALSNTSPSDGGGLYLEPDTVSVLEKSQVWENRADRAAGMYLAGRTTITNCEFSRNSAVRYHGALFVNSAADANVVHSSILSNQAGDTTGGIGCLGKAHISHCLFQDNKSYYGAAFQVEEPTSVVFCEHSQFIANEARGPGGALRCWVNTAPVFVDCNFIENKAYWGGAGICESGSHPTFEHCQFKKNETYTYGGQGGSFFLRGASARFLSCTFIESSSPSSDGGVAWCESDTSRFESCTIDRPIAGGSGGAFCIVGAAQPVFSQVQIVNSRAGINGGGIAVLGTSKPLFAQVTINNSQTILFGGGVYAAENTRSAFEECKFLYNQTTGVSADGGGAFFRGKANGSFTRCTFQHNIAKDDGGGVAADEQALLDLRNTLFAANTARNSGGGAYFTSAGAGTFTNCTIVGNSADAGSGGGIYTDSKGLVKVDSSIICRNVPEGFQAGANPRVSYSCVQGTPVWPGLGNRICDDCGLLDPNTFELQNGSPCIDAGNPDPSMNDGRQPPGKGGLRNDMGITGGPDNRKLSSDPDLAGWWTFDQVTGTGTPDSSGRGQLASLMNGATLVPGRSGKVVHLDGGNDYVDLRIGGLIVTLTDSTFAGWVNFRNTGGPWQRIFDFGTETMRYMFLTPRMSAAGAMRFGITLTNTADYTVDAKTMLPTGWHHVAVTFNAGTITLYLDGVPLASIRSPLTPSSLGITANNWLGKSRFPASGYLNADLDDFRIYSRALGPQDLAAVMEGR